MPPVLPAEGRSLGWSRGQVATLCPPAVLHPSAVDTALSSQHTNHDQVQQGVVFLMSFNSDCVQGSQRRSPRAAVGPMACTELPLPPARSPSP